MEYDDEINEETVVGYCAYTILYDLILSMHKIKHTSSSAHLNARLQQIDNQLDKISEKLSDYDSVLDNKSFKYLNKYIN